MPSIELNNETMTNEAFIVRSSKPAIEYPNVSIAESIAKAIEKRDTNLIALINPTNDCTLTYGELHRQAQEFAVALVKCGATKGDFVLFYAENCFQYVVAMLGTTYLGLAFCSVPPACGSFELTEQIKDSSGTILVFGNEKIGTIEKALNNSNFGHSMQQLRIAVQLNCEKPDKALIDHLIMADKKVHSFAQLLDLGSDKQLKSIPYFPFVDLTNEHYFICYTSGTTGKPKGAIHTNKSFLAAFINTYTVLMPKATNINQPSIMWYPIGHMSGTFMLLYTFFVGDALILFAHCDLNSLLAAVERYKVKSLAISSNLVVPLVNNDYHKMYDLSSLVVIPHGGAKIPANLLAKIREKYKVITIDLYGATEFVGGMGDRNWPDFYAKFEPGNLGTVVPNAELKIIDLENGKALPANQSGEICTRGPSCFIGYLNNKQATESTLVNGWYHSGDVGYYDQNGCLFITDRIKEMIKYKMYSVTPAEIEDFIHTHKAVEAVCVVGVPHTTDGNLIRAYVQVVNGKSVTEQELIDYVKDNMGSQKRIRAGVRFIEKIPRTVIGKVDRQYFKRLVQNELLTELVS